LGLTFSLAIPVREKPGSRPEDTSKSFSLETTDVNRRDKKGLISLNITVESKTNAERFERSSSLP
jgi:hypothetical protein